MLVQLLQKEKYTLSSSTSPLGHPIVVGTPEDFDEASINQLFFIGIQTNEQRKLLVKGSRTILIVDDTHNVTQYET